ncbi:MAG TPA: type II secretion system protein GspC [Geopsychrobacteraceae bacterium]|nr:type II secretion system protein GspC [Geopsychrobacteraceae bacterium]
MTFDLQKNLNILLVLLTVCLGVLLGRLIADRVAIFLAPETSFFSLVTTEPTETEVMQLRDFNIISQRNLFDSVAKPEAADNIASSSVSQAQNRPAPNRAADLTLFGTVAGGESPLAVIESGKETNVYRVGDTLPGGLSLFRVERDKAIVVSADGEESILEMIVEKSQIKTPGAAAPQRRRNERSNESAVRIVELGENHWQIPSEEAEKARSNLNALLKTARMVPKIENGATVGFTIVHIQPGTFLDLLGLKAGDVLVQINQVELNSPEKALQIFQQVREANNLSLGLLRNGSRQTFEYTID